MSYKNVSHVIRVPSGTHCWEFFGDKSICKFFNNEGGHSTCELEFSPLKDVYDGVIKAQECYDLETIDEPV